MIAKVFFLINVFVVISAVMQLPQAWKRKNLPGARPLIMLTLFIGAGSFVHILNFFTDYTRDLVFIEKVFTSFTFFTMFGWVWLMIEFLIQKNVKFYYPFVFYPILLVLIVFTNSLHGLFFVGEEIVLSKAIPNVVFDFGPIRKIHRVIIIVTWITATIWGLVSYFKNPRGEKYWFYLVIFFVVYGFVERYLYVHGFLPFTMASVFGMLIVVAAVRYYRLLDLIPVARKQLVENLKDGIAILNSDLEIADYNAKFQEWSNTQIPNTKPLLKINELSNNLSQIGSFLSRGVMSEKIMSNDQTLAFDIQDIVQNEEIVGYSLIIRDDTKEAQLAQQKEFYTQQLEKSKTELERLDQMKSNFFSNVTHEFRTPLTLIQEPARGLIDFPDQKVRESARLISNNSNKLLELVNELLTLTRLDSGKVGLNMKTGDVTEVIRSEFHKFLSKAEKENIKLKLEVIKEFPLISFDQQKIESIVANLLSNALKYTDEGSVEMTLSHTAAPQKQYTIIVKDTGRGIPEDSLYKVFDRFYQVDSSDTRKGEGTGIGLALTQQMVHLMGGEITVESTLGQGSIFKVVLPMEKHAMSSATSIDNQEEEGEVKTPKIESKQTESKVITRNDDDLKIALVVEDNAELRQFIKSGLESHYQMATAANGKEGLQQAKALLPDVIISDVMMPEKDGITMLQELKTDPLTSHIPIILLTAKSAVEDRLKGLSRGADQYLTKPFRMDELIIISNNLIMNRMKATQKYIEAFQAKTPSHESMNEPENDFIRDLILVIESEMENENIQIDDYAAKMYMSRTHLHRKIKSLTDQSTTEFIRNYRLDKAMSMLRQKEGNVQEIASKVGFSSEKYFSTSFKKKFGVSPSQV